jgi:hypothetical protein
VALLDEVGQPAGGARDDDIGAVTERGHLWVLGHTA